MSFGPIMWFEVNGLQIELGPIAKEDVAVFVEPGTAMNQSSVTRYLAHHTAYVLEDEYEWFEYTRKDATSIIWGIWLLEDDKRTLIGNSSLTHMRMDYVRSATSGSLIFRKEFWGRGIASAAHKARTWYAFRRMGLHKIDSEVIQGNHGSRKALERSGYQVVNVQRNKEFVSGKLVHVDQLECLNPDTPFWSEWWHSDRPTKSALAARKLTREVLNWADEHVELA